MTQQELIALMASSIYSRLLEFMGPNPSGADLAKMREVSVDQAIGINALVWKKLEGQ